MILDQYIEMLTSLRNHYNAGNFEVRIREVTTGASSENPMEMTVEDFDWTNMDGDDFWLNLEEKTLNIDCKTRNVH
jgi:hypothetical protein